ncbi:hypothetical protein HYU09_00065 [Candidatus Woesearchaeota archaeon]|nr:hypothetical protein [Candidatus Woesearchaeota archaeon]
MRKTMVLLAIFVLAALLIFGCTKQSQYPTGYAAYGQQNPQYQGYVGGGCAVAGPDIGNVDVSEPAAAA